MSEITVRPIDYARDPAALRSFLDERDRMRLDHCRVAVEAGDAAIFVVEADGSAVGWAAVHFTFRDDQDWEPDPDSQRFQQGDNAYLENIEVTAGVRGQGGGTKLLEAVQAEAKRRGKATIWLHTSENNEKAHKVFDRSGWVHESSVYPPWKPGSRMRIYKKVL